MYNFVNDLDNIYGQKKSEIREYNVDNDFCIYIPVTIETKSFLINLSLSTQGP